MTTPPPSQRGESAAPGSPLRRAQNLMASTRARVAPPRVPPAAELRPLEERVNALEAMVEGLQDAVDRESRRHDAQLEELMRRLEPAELARVLSDDARKRGL